MGLHSEYKLSKERKNLKYVEIILSLDSSVQGEKKVLAAEYHHLMLNSPKPNFGEIYTKHCDAQKSTMTEVGKT